MSRAGADGARRRPPGAWRGGRRSRRLSRLGSLAALVLTLTACDYVRQLRPKVLKQLNPRVVRLVNELPEVDAPNKEIIANARRSGARPRG